MKIEWPRFVQEISANSFESAASSPVCEVYCPAPRLLLDTKILARKENGVYQPHT